MDLTNLTDILDNEYTTIAVALFLFLYGYTLARIKLPGYIKNLFKNNIFRVLYLSLLLILTFKKAPSVAITVALVFVITMYYLNIDEIEERFSDS